MKWLRFLKWKAVLLLVLLLCSTSLQKTAAVEIPLDAITPVRVGFIDLQKVFDTFPEKAFAEGDLLKEIEKRKLSLVRRQAEINQLRQQISADQTALDQAQAGRPVVVPHDSVSTDAAPAEAPPPVTPDTTKVNTSTTNVEPYPTDEPLAGLPGHDTAASSNTTSVPALPGLGLVPRKHETSPMLDLLASATGPTLLNVQAINALEKRLADNHKLLDHDIYEFKDFRTKAVDDMKALQTQKTYGVMSKIYAVLQSLARDESVMIVMDKAYVLYGEDTVDLTDKLITRLNAPGGEGAQQ